MELPRALKCLLLKLDEHAAYFLDVLVFPNQVLVAQHIAEAELVCLAFRFQSCMEGAVLGPKLLGRVACHPKRFFVDHSACPRRSLRQSLESNPDREFAKSPDDTILSN